MKALAVITFIILLSSCQSNAIKMDEVESIRIVSNQREQPQDTVVITAIDQIKEITSMLENVKKEPVKFLADYKVELNFKDSTVILFVRNDLLNNQGITYKLEKNLGKRLDEITKAAH